MLGGIMHAIGLTVEREDCTQSLDGISLQGVAMRAAVVALQEAGQEGLVLFRRHVTSDVGPAHEQGTSLCRMGQEMVAQRLREGLVFHQRIYMSELLPTLDYWKRYKELGGNGKFEEFKKKLIGEINDLKIAGMPKVEKLNALVGSYVNLAYRLPNGIMAKFLDDNATYLGNQLECEFGGDRCFGVLANMDFILVSTYGKNGEDPELLVYKKR